MIKSIKNKLKPSRTQVLLNLVKSLMKTKALRFSVYFYFCYNLLKLKQKELFADVKENFSKFLKGKRLCWSLILITLDAKDLFFCLKQPPAQVFPCELCKICKFANLQNFYKYLFNRTLPCHCF